MYKAFELNGDELITKIKNNPDFYNEMLVNGKKSFDKNIRKIDTELNKFRTNDGIIDGRKLTNNWFPSINADVFISHSHKDFDTALIVAGLLESIGINSFIDSCVWGYSGDLLKAIDNIYCKNRTSNTYNYKKRNYSTEHVHMMLTIALAKMIYNTECLLFLQTPNSIYPKDSIPDICDEVTLSPWIYAELEMTGLIKHRSVEEHRTLQKAFSESTESLKVAYVSENKNLEHLSAKMFVKWLSTFKWLSRRDEMDKYKALNTLYSINDSDDKPIYG